ncbi:hypothetical protein CIHG_04420 [Coccidioides immitis H538.4]|uniref:Uncharacterized protein n=3 Tax=Coccidioides immitis TaxID=5501 RepID=A0A0J8R6M6_COCIT|nr:hypothetical protein CIRG_09353 [Coccidioides immitis RMSCC 2394]KMU80075.1 hypothetical protein CISG_08417 [Coccidioides immitis RMSCC 3703]KMU86632.1 hypothetical protein CIHG_04420 [Coccidioides immitis H538.4]
MVRELARLVSSPSWFVKAIVFDEWKPHTILRWHRERRSFKVNDYLQCRSQNFWSQNLCRIRAQFELWSLQIFRGDLSTLFQLWESLAKGTFCRVWAYASDDVISPLRLGSLGSGLARGPPIARLHRLMRMPDQGPHHGALHGHFDSAIQTSYAETNDSASIPFPSSLAQWI